MASIWTTDIPTIVFSRTVSDFSEDLKTKYKMQKLTVNGITTWRNFSTSQVSETPPIFPYITVIELPGAEKGQDLEGTSVNGGLFTFQVDVYHNSSETIARNCMAEVFRVMKTMRFNGMQIPYPQSQSQEYRQIAQFSRVIGASDPL